MFEDFLFWLAKDALPGLYYFVVLVIDVIRYVCETPKAVCWDNGNKC